MTPQYILRRALCRDPHCFRAHVPGQGYVNDGSDPTTRAEYLRQYWRAAESAIENLGYARTYAEPGYDDPERGILFADWNTLPKGVESLLERAGYAIEWSDEWATCEECGGAVRTSPDGFDWRPSYCDGPCLESGSMVCRDCCAGHDDDHDDDQDDADADAE